MISAIVALLVIFLIGAALYKMVRGDKKVLSKASSSNIVPVDMQRRELSDVSHTIYRQFMALDETARPVEDIRPMLEALDIKDGNYGVDEHLITYSLNHRNYFDEGDDEEYLCHGHKYNGSCPYQPYLDLHDSIVAVQQAYKARERALELAGIENDLSQISIITSRLRDEASIANAVAKELGVKQ